MHFVLSKVLNEIRKSLEEEVLELNFPRSPRDSRPRAAAVAGMPPTSAPLMPEYAYELGCTGTPTWCRLTYRVRWGDGYGSGTPTWCRLTYRVRWGDGYGSGTPGKCPQHV
ncbi:hypothetical protein DY000_02022830 [Brassica cretica]|uniref:Uncharacterized protein n=1 Tax=Brassica cretica TaxID=69181 RepID=A0ABQ7EB34_BRACR|nr:hypothetical protein DY000_02022830 [Brassica cretica]